MQTSNGSQSLNNRLMQLLSPASAALQKSDLELSLEARSRTFGAPLPSITKHNGSAQLSYFIYSCTVRTQPHRHTPANAGMRAWTCVQTCFASDPQCQTAKEQKSETKASNQAFPIFFLSREVRKLVEPNGIEPMTSCLQSRRSPS
jgi:hypothetical protein